MNNVLELKGKRFVQARRNVNGGGIAMNGKNDVSTQHLLRLKSQLSQIKFCTNNCIIRSRPFKKSCNSITFRNNFIIINTN